VSIGLVALLDDVAALAKAAAASIDDIAAQAAKAGGKAAGVVIDDAAVTPRYVTGFAAARELPIIWRIAAGSLRNKLLFLLPAALALSLFAPSLITPLLMAGGAYLCYEGTEKVYEGLFPDQAHAHETKLATVAVNSTSFEDEKVASAIKTDFILSAEIMAITLAAVPEGSFLARTAVLALVGVGITATVYGAVALIVKADDAGVALASRPGRGSFGGITRALGRGLVIAMPVFLKGLSVVGTAAMIWVGGGIIVHGLEEYGLTLIADTIHHAAELASHLLPAVVTLGSWAVAALGSSVVGLLVGAALIPVTELVLAPAWRTLARRRPA
jgi:predicted DNA repair protein MutK